MRTCARRGSKIVCDRIRSRFIYDPAGANQCGKKVEVCSRVQDGYAMIYTLCVFSFGGAFHFIMYCISIMVLVYCISFCGHIIPIILYMMGKTPADQYGCGTMCKPFCWVCVLDSDFLLYNLMYIYIYVSFMYIVVFPLLSHIWNCNITLV